MKIKTYQTYIYRLRDHQPRVHLSCLCLWSLIHNIRFEMKINIMTIGIGSENILVSKQKADDVAI